MPAALVTAGVASADELQAKDENGSNGLNLIQWAGLLAAAGGMTYLGRNGRKILTKSAEGFDKLNRMGSFLKNVGTDIGGDFIRPTMFLKQRMGWLGVPEHLRPAYREVTNALAKMERAKMGGPDAHAESRAFLDRYGDLTREDLQEANKWLAGWRDANPSPAAMKMIEEMQERYSAAARRISAAYKELGMEGMDPTMRELHPSRRNLDATPLGSSLGELWTGPANALTALSGQGKGMHGADLAERVVKGLDQTLYVKDGKLHSTNGRIPPYLEAQKKSLDILRESDPNTPKAILDVTSNAELEQALEFEKTRFKRELMADKAAPKSLREMLEEQPRKMPLIEGAHDVTLFDFMDEMSRIEGKADVLEALPKSFRERLGAPKEGRDELTLSDLVTTLTGNSRLGKDLEQEMGVLLGQSIDEQLASKDLNKWLKAIAEIRPAASRSVLSLSSSGPAAKQNVQLALSNIGVPSPELAFKAWIDRLAGDINPDMDPHRPRTTYESFSVSNEKRAIKDRQHGLYMFKQEVMDEPSEFMQMMYSDDDLARARWLVQNDPESPELERLSRSYAARLGEISGSSSLPTSQAATFRGPVAGAMFQFLNTPLTSLATQLSMFNRAGMGKATKLNKIRMATSLVAQGAGQFAVSTSPGLKAGALLAGGAGPQALVMGTRALTGEDSKSERRAKDAAEMYLGVMQRIMRGDGAGATVSDITRAAMALAVTMAPIPGADPSALIMEAGNSMDAKLGYKGGGPNASLAEQIAGGLSVATPLGAASGELLRMYKNANQGYQKGHIGSRFLWGQYGVLPFTKDFPTLYGNPLPFVEKDLKVGAPAVNGISYDKLFKLQHPGIKIPNP